MSKKEDHSSSVPDPYTFYLETPLYSEFSIESADYAYIDVLRIEFYNGSLDAYCIDCKKESVFNSLTKLPDSGPVSQPVSPASLDDFVEQSTAHLPSGKFFQGQQVLQNTRLDEYALKDRIVEAHFVCTRNPKHQLVFFLRIYNGVLSKIGQYPSLADLQSANIKKYRGILDESKYREFNRAIGLNAHGIGIGAFVYLRRILEGLIEEAHIEASKDEAWDETIFIASRMDDKILMLKDYLPSFLTENRKIYSILSKGLHSLTEEECLEYFEPLRVSIELMLDEKIRQKETDSKTKSTQKALGSILGKIG